MKIIVDTNCIVSALIKDALSRKIINDVPADFITIQLTGQELQKYEQEILTKSGVTKGELNILLNHLMRRISVVDDEVVQSRMEDAKKIMDHIDPGDTPFIAAALATNAAIWSDDKHFEKQTVVKIFKTSDLLSPIT